MKRTTKYVALDVHEPCPTRHRAKAFAFGQTFPQSDNAPHSLASLGG